MMDPSNVLYILFILSAVWVLYRCFKLTNSPEWKGLRDVVEGINAGTAPAAIDETGALIKRIQEGMTNEILNNHPRLFESIAKQKRILNENSRPTVAIFLSEQMTKNLLLGSNLVQEDQLEALFEVINNLRVPVALIGDIPVYISTKMDSPVFVAAAINWEM